MRVTDVFEGADEALWTQLTAEPVTRVDIGRREGNLVVQIELAPLVDPWQILVLQQEDTLVLVRSTDRAVLYRLPLQALVGPLRLHRTPTGLTVTAPLAGPTPLPVHLEVLPARPPGRLRAAFRPSAERVRALSGKAEP